jgi:hypothetical protein
VTALICAIALTVTPGACARGGHAETVPPPRGGQSVTIILVRELPRFPAWVCIHQHEGAWNDSGDPYWGGLQMDRSFMWSYGADMIRLHHGGLADTWTPAEQIIVAERAYTSGRGFGPWPNTRIPCHV